MASAGTVNISRIQKAIFCAHNMRINLISGSVECSVENCSCSEEQHFSTIMDLYSHIYYLLAVNTPLIQNLVDHHDDQVRKATSVISKVFKTSLPEQPIFQLSTWDGLIDDVGHSIVICTDVSGIALNLYAWLRVLDDHIGNIRLLHARTSTNAKPMYRTQKGDLIFRCTSAINNYVIEL